jgi:hypothetical protein
MYVRVKRLEVVTNVNIKYDAKVLRVGWDIRHHGRNVINHYSIREDKVNVMVRCHSCQVRSGSHKGLKGIIHTAL